MKLRWAAASLPILSSAKRRSIATWSNVSQQQMLLQYHPFSSSSTGLSWAARRLLLWLCFGWSRRSAIRFTSLNSGRLLSWMMWFARGTNCHSKVGTKAAFSSKGRLTRLWWWKRSLRKYSLERLLQKYFIQDQNLFRSKGVPVQEVAIPPVVDGPGGESHPKREHLCSHQDQLKTKLIFCIC